MARKKKTDAPTEKASARDISGWTKPRQFRLTDDTLAELDAIARHLSAETGVEHSRTDAIRYALRQTARSLGLRK